MEIIFEDGLVRESLTTQIVYHAILQSVENTHGDYGISCIKKSFKVKYINPYTSVVFIKCSRDYYRMLWQAITFLKDIAERRCFLRTLHLGGTIKSCQRFLIKHNKEQLVKMLAQCKTSAERQTLSNVIGRLPTVESRLAPLEAKKRRQDELAWKHLSC